MDNVLKPGDLEKIHNFVQTYDKLYTEMSVLESRVQDILLEQEKISNDLADKRAEENRFFAELSSRENCDISHLKRLATTWMEENNVKTYSQTCI